ncbi:hypothetical protein BC829DRAFT_446831 [Chytridium lagenaria]|nr:hypothetical protein BC829DRAFT_446831 [Chytridium lagenaria]
MDKRSENEGYAGAGRPPLIPVGRGRGKGDASLLRVVVKRRSLAVAEASGNVGVDVGGSVSASGAGIGDDAAPLAAGSGSGTSNEAIKIDDVEVVKEEDAEEAAVVEDTVRKRNPGLSSRRAVDESTADEMEAGEELADEEVGFPVIDEEEDLERRRRRKKRKKRKKDTVDPPKKKKKFSLAPRNWVDRLLFLWGFRLLQRIRRQEDIHDVPLHLKSSETAKFTGDALERTWNEEVKRCSGGGLERVATESAPPSRFSRGEAPSMGSTSSSGPGVAPVSVAAMGQQGRGSSDKTFISLPDESDASSEPKRKTPVPRNDVERGPVRCNGKPRLRRALNRAFGVSFSLLSIWKALWALFTWLGAYGILKWVIDWCETRKNGGEVKAFQGHLLAVALFASSSLSSLCFHQLSIQCTRIGVQCRAALMVLIYRKSLRLSYVKGGVGDIVNLIANECNRVAEASVTWHYMWSAIAECAIIIALAFYDIGIAALPAFFLIMFILLPLQYLIAVRASDISIRSTGLITKRVHLMSELLTAIKLIKFYAWEGHFVRRIDEQRGREMGELRAAMMLRAANWMVVFIAPVLATLGCLLVAIYTWPEGLTAASVFTLLSLFNTLRYPLLLLPNAVRTYNGATFSFQHLEDFFNLPEVDAPVPKAPPADDPDLLIDIKNANFVWDGELDHPSILDLSLEIRRGQLIAVVGDLSSGKSLLAAILGQVKRRTGSMYSYGTCGYAPQEPWLINATIRDNIVFGLEYDEQLYLDVIRMCGLTRDLMLLSNGDDSIVSDLNLSPSQRQRLSLARCLYHNPDLVLIEDCLSDFDQAHAKRLFKEFIRNNLLKKGKAVVLVTQQKQFLPECDLILVLKGERIIERGTFAELKARKVNFSAWVSDYVPIDDDPAGVLDGVNEIRLDGPPQGTVSGSSPMSPVSSPVSRFVAVTGKAAPGTQTFALATADVITQDPMELQSVGPDADPGQMTIRAIMALNQQSIQNAQINEHTISKMIERNQLSVLTGNSTRPPANFPNQDPVTRTIEANQLTVHSVNGFDPASAAGDKGIITRNSFSPLMAYDMYFKEGYGRIVGWSILVLFFLVHGIRFFSDYWLQLFVDGNETQSPQLHLGIYGILTAAIAIGVFSRGALFSNSVLLDESLPDATLQALSFAPIPLGTLALVAAVVPWFWVTLPVYFVLAYFLIWKCAHAEKKLRTLEGINKSPMFAHLSTTLEGLFSIRLYHAQERFDAFNRILIDADHKALYSLMLIKVLQALYLDLISSLAIYMTAVLVIASPVTGSTAGLAISNALQLLLFVQWMVRMGTDVHLCMTSVAAVTSFTDHVPVEPSDSLASVKPPPDWPSSGAIEFKHVTLRYHRYGIAVLKAVSFQFNPGEKIGIVGRSGSGKTTLLVALMRIVDEVEGEVIVDGIDISTIGLSDLRSRIAVIPQEPVLLTGTIRTNLDPSDVRTDEEVWQAVRDVHLGAKIEEMPLKLNTPIIENGRAFSLAERQLFCVARAILMKTKIVIFDEPTTAADNDTDTLIQSTIHENFADATVIVLASRFRMITQADRIIVMDGGRIVESDTPLALLDNPRSKLSLMVSQTGDIDIAKLRQLAHTRAEAKAASKQAQQQQQEQQVKTVSANASAVGLNSMVGNVQTMNNASTSSATSPILKEQLGQILGGSVYDSHSSISTLSSSHSAAEHSNAALNTTSSGSSFMASSLLLPGGTMSARKPGAMPKSLEGIFGETAQLERQQKAAASLSNYPLSPITPTSPSGIVPPNPSGVIASNPTGLVRPSSASVHSNGNPSISTFIILSTSTALRMQVAAVQKRADHFRIVSEKRMVSRLDRLQDILNVDLDGDDMVTDDKPEEENEDEANVNTATAGAPAGFCVECEDTPASINCLQCQDDFCEVCFQSQHRKGSRKKHASKRLASEALENGEKASKSPRVAEAKDEAEEVAVDANPKFELTGTESALQVGLDTRAGDWFLERSKFIPLRLSLVERKYLRLLEAALIVSEYTDKIDILSYTSKTKRQVAQIQELCSIISGLLLATDYKEGQTLFREKNFQDNEMFFQDIFELGRRHKIMNPEKMRSTYGKLIYMLQDSQIHDVKDMLDGLKLLEDNLVVMATKEIVSAGRSRYEIQKEIKMKERAIETLAKKYAKADLTPDEIRLCLYSIGDNHAYLRTNRDPCDKMIEYLKSYFTAEKSEKNYSLAIQVGRGGARLSHDHSKQYSYVLQSLTLWREIMHDMFMLWSLSESDLLSETNPYRLRDTGQGLNRVQAAPQTSRMLHKILHRAQQRMGYWIGSSVIHMGDHNVPNAFMFIDKYTQIFRILLPSSHAPRMDCGTANVSGGISTYIDEVFGGIEEAQKIILADFFRHGFDGSGADNFFDAGSCIDGRLTSAWNWCSTIEKKPYFPLFLLSGFVGFDGQWAG